MTFVQRLTACLRWLELGGTIETSSGHTLEWSPEHESFGFAYTSFDTKTKENSAGIMQIDSDGAWQFLVHHARKMTEEQFTIMTANLALNEAKRAKR
jgi:hypothetical protein